MKKQNSFRRVALHSLALVFFLACISLITNACHRHVVKYGGPPADYDGSSLLKANAPQDLARK